MLMKISLAGWQYKGTQYGQAYSMFLRRRNLLNSESIVQQTVAREVLVHILLHKLNTKIRIVHS